MPDPQTAANSLVDPGTFVQAIQQYGERSAPDAVSDKGAQGTMQVMPASATDPGFGVRPAANNSPAELQRVGRDYAAALLQHYGDPGIAAAAYNAGPTKVQHWLAKYGDPRTGDLSSDEFVNSIPFSETRNYAKRVTGALPREQSTNLLTSDVTTPVPAKPSSSGMSMTDIVNYLSGATHTLEPVIGNPFAYTAETVPHDPFSTTSEPVSHDPFAEASQ